MTGSEDSLAAVWVLGASDMPRFYLFRLAKHDRLQTAEPIAYAIMRVLRLKLA